MDLPQSIKILSQKRNKNNKEIYSNIFLKFKNGEIYLISNESKVFLNETLIISNDKKMRIDFNENRVELFNTKKFDLLKGYKQFLKKRDIIYTTKNYQKDTLKEIIKNFDNKKFIKKLNQSNIKTLKFISFIEKTLKSHKHKLTR